MERKSLVIGPRTRQDILKGKHIRKFEDGGDNFDDYWTDSDDASSSISKDSEHFLELPKEHVHTRSSTFFKTSDGRNSSLRQKIDQSPLKSRGVQSPLRSRGVHSPLKSRGVHSPLKAREVLPNNILNVHEIATEFQDMTINLGINDNNSETEALNQFSSANIVKNNLSTKLSSIPSEIQNISNSSLPNDGEEYDESEVPRLVSKISFKTSKKSISRSTKKDPKIREVQMQFDELDEKIMQMVHVNVDNNDNTQNSLVSEEEMSLTEQPSFKGKKKKQEIEQVFKNIQEKENCSDFELYSENASSTRSIRRNTRSLSQSINDSESTSLKNMDIKRSEDTSEHQKNQKKRVTCQKNDFIQSQCTGKKSNSSSVPQCEKISSETFISKKNLTDSKSHSMDVSVDSDDDESHIASEQDIETDEIQTNEQMTINKSTMPENDFNSPVNSFENTNDIDFDKVNDSSVPERNDPIHQHSSKTVMSENSLPDSPNANSHFEKSKLLKDSFSRSKTIPSNNENISKSEFSDISDIDNSSNICMVEKQKTANEKNILPDKTIHDAVSFNQTRTVEQPKSLVNKEYNSTAEGNDSIEKDEINIEKTIKKQNKFKNRKSKTAIAKKSAFLSDEDIETADLDNISQLETSDRQKTRNSSKAVENNNISDKIIHDAANFNQTQTVEQRKSLVNKKYNSTAEGNDSIEKDEINIEKTIKKQNEIKNKKRKTSIAKKCAFLSDEDVEIADLNSKSQLETSNRKKTRNNSRAIENDDDNISFNSFTSSANSISGVNKTSNKQNKSVNKTNQTKNKKSSMLHKVDIETADIDSLSHLQDSNKKENKKNKNSNLQKITTNKRASSMLHDESIVEAAILNDSSEDPISKRQKTSANKRNSLITQENDLFHASAGSSEDSLNDVNMMKITEKQKKIENSKKRDLHDKSNIEDKKQSRTHVTKKSTVAKNNLDKENEGSIFAAIRKSERKKYAPLAHWRNERLQCRFVDGKIAKVDLDKGTKEDIAFLESLNTRLMQQKKKKKISKPPKAKILDVINNKEKRLHLLKKFPLIAWDSPVRCRTDENAQFAFLIKRMIETKKNSFGYIYIGVNKTKPPQYMPEEDLLLIVFEGNLEIRIQSDKFVLENKDMFIVPRGSAYSITNIGKKRALLSYAVGKFKYLESF